MNAIRSSISAFAFLFSLNAVASGLNCPALFDPTIQTVRAEYAKLLKVSRQTPKVANQHNIDSPDFINEMVRISFFTGVDTKTISQQTHDILAIQSKPGVPDGNELSLKTLTQILMLANTAKVDPKSVFKTTVDFLPLAEGRVGDEGSLLELVKLSVIYKKTPQQVIDTLDKIAGASKSLNEKIRRKAEEKLAEMDSLSQSLARLAGAANQGIGEEMTIAMIEAALATKKPAAQIILAVDQLLDDGDAMRYTMHEKAAMLKAFVIHGQSLTTSVSQLKELETGAQHLFGANLTEDVERPAVNLILLESVPPKTVLNSLSNVNTTGQRYSQSAMVMVLNKILILSADSELNRQLAISTALRLAE